MTTSDGLSLTEVLVSLAIVTSASMALLQQQWRVTRYIHRIHHQYNTLQQIDNTSEQFKAGYFLSSDSKELNEPLDIA